MPSPLDEYPVHQTPLPMDRVATSDRNFYDRCYLNLHDQSGDVFMVTGLGVYGFDESTGEMELWSRHPGVTLEQIQENTGWELRVSANVEETAPPSEDELRLIREELDPGGAYAR